MPWPVIRITSASGCSAFDRARMPRPSMSFITRSVMTTSKGDSSISRAPSLPEVATRQWKPTAFETLGHGLGVRLVVVDDQHFGGRIEGMIRRFGFSGGSWT